MARFLSSEWLDTLASALSAAGPLDSTERLALGQIVTGTPHGDLSYTLFIGGGEPSEVRPGTDDAAITLVEEYSTAVALSSGGPSADLLAAGSVKVRGDVGALLRSQELLATVGPILGAMSGATEY